VDRGTWFCRHVGVCGVYTYRLYKTRAVQIISLRQKSKFRIQIQNAPQDPNAVAQQYHDEGKVCDHLISLYHCRR
jgi:hypothetical protein